MPAHHLPNCDELPKIVVLTDVDYLGPEGCPRPMLLGRENQYQAAQKHLAQLSVQRLFLGEWLSCLAKGRTKVFSQYS